MKSQNFRSDIATKRDNWTLENVRATTQSILAAVFVTGATILGFLACQQSSAKSISPAESQDQEEMKVRKSIAIPSLAVKLDADDGCDLSDDTEQAQFPTATIYTDPTIFVVGANEMFWQKNMANQKADIRKAPGNKFRRFTKEIALEGGFLLEFELSSMMEEHETLYGFHLRSTVNGHQFDCSSNTSSVVKMNKGVSICQTLRPM